MDKKAAKRYLISVLLLFFVTALISAVVIFSLILSGISNVDLSVLQRILLSVACGAIPAGSFTGFTVAFINIEKINTFWKIAIYFLFPITVVVINAFGIIAIIPTIIYSIIVLAKK
jgi:hypothetical protein